MPKRIASVDGVDNGIINCTISSEAKGTPIQGSFAKMELDNRRWLVRMQSVSLKNPIHENDQFAPFIMARGYVPEWSGHTDIERAKAEVVSIINEHGKPVPRDRNCPSGTPIETLEEDSIVDFQREKTYQAVIGVIANSNIGASVINRHFGKHSERRQDMGGYGEARHIAIFGRNGSGKSVWVLQLLAAKIAKHKEMGFVIPDTQGDFADSTKHSRGEFEWDYKEVLKAAGVEVETINVRDIALKSKEALKDLLRKCIHTIYSMDGEKASTLSGRIVEGLFDKEVDPAKLTAEIIAKEVIEKIEHVYAKANRAVKREDAENVLYDIGRLRQLRRELDRNVRIFFEGEHDIREIVEGVLRKHRKIVIEMEGWTQNQQMFVMQDLMLMLKRSAQKMYKSGYMEPANAIVVLDEAPRWLPQGEDPEIKQIVSQALRETRKAGVGWWIVGQSPADVDKTVLKQAHMTWFGRGLGIGADENHVRSMLGETGYETYKEMQRRPGRYFWVGIGLDNNLGHDNTHIAVEPFGGNSTQRLMNANPHIWTKEPTL